ncbi:zinc-binding dehydrogenase family protein [Mycobacterium xenopi 4042]|uniref:Alcohol dehydrogenase n=1 Tax=Mycobacterium xenopi 4042 TaxID=1299334 RepID=X8BG66_MYCXE|nr:zinc-binding dehydrogenase family protein [Mycobacterium xenopi 4042]
MPQRHLHPLRKPQGAQLAISGWLRGIGDRAGQCAGPNPPELSFAEAAPMGCAGVTTYNALRHTKAVAGDRVAVLGVGGLGHLGVQFSRAMGFETVAIARGAGKTDDARRLGAHHYIDSTKNDVAEALRALGGVAVVLATAGNSAAMAATVGGLLPRGELVAIGVTTEPLPISPLQLINPASASPATPPARRAMSKKP